MTVLIHQSAPCSVRNVFPKKVMWRPIEEGMTSTLGLLIHKLRNRQLYEELSCGWRDDLAAKSTDRSSGPEFNFQQPHGSTQLYKRICCSLLPCRYTCRTLAYKI